MGYKKNKKAINRGPIWTSVCTGNGNCGSIAREPIALSGVLGELRYRMSSRSMYYFMAEVWLFQGET